MKTPTIDSFKVIIAGSRDFNDYETLKSFCDKMLQRKTNIEIISGTAKGADQLGEKYAVEKNFKLTKVPAEWRNGKSAGYRRNEKMAEMADALIAFWDGESKGTKHMINCAKKNNLTCRIYYYNGDTILIL